MERTEAEIAEQKARLAREVAKLDPEEQQRMAEEGMSDFWEAVKDDDWSDVEAQ